MALENRYHRQTLIEGWDQSKLMDACVLIAGVGALGCEVGKNLATMGIGHLILIDNDTIEISNLCRQMLFTDSDIGLPKVEVAAKKLSLLNPHCEISPYYCKIEEVPFKVFRSVDLVVGGLDNWPTRRFLNSVCVELDKPYIDGGIEGLLGNVQVIVPFKTACLECYGSLLVPEETRKSECTLRTRKPEDLIKDLKRENVRVPELETIRKLFEAGFKTVFDLKFSKVDDLLKVGGVDKAFVEEFHEQLKPKMPACQTVNAVIGGIESHETIKIIMGGKIGSPINNFLQFDGVVGVFTCLELTRNEECIVCGENFRLKGTEFYIDTAESIRDLKERITSILGYPDVQLQYKNRILSDDSIIESIGIQDGDLLYAHTSRRARPAKLIAKVSYTS